MTQLGDAAFVAAMRKAHPELKYTGKSCKPPMIETFLVSNRVLEPVIHRDVLLVSSDVRIQRAAILSKRTSYNFAARVIEVVAAVGELSVKDLKGDSRLKHIVYWRHIAMYLLRKHGHSSFPFIGSVMNRDHSSALHAYRKIDKDLETYKADIQKSERYL